EAVAFLTKAAAPTAALPLHPFMSVEGHLRSKRRIPAHPHHDMAPFRIDDLKIIVLHMRPGISMTQIDNLPALIELHLPDRRRSPAREHRKDTPELGVFGQKRLGQDMLLLSALAFDKRNPALLAPRSQAPGKVSGHGLHSGIGQSLLASLPDPPPRTESAAGLSEGKIGVDHDAIDTIVTAFQQIGIIAGQIVMRFCCSHQPRLPIWGNPVTGCATKERLFFPALRWEETYS